MITIIILNYNSNNKNGDITLGMGGIQDQLVLILG